MKKLTSLILALILVLSLVACGGGEDAATDGGDDAAALTTITVGASSTPHAEILEQVKESLAADGYDLKIVVYDDYVLPNTALNDGELDANYFQHTPYLESFNASNGTELSVAGLIHYEPFGMYGNGVSSVADIAAGATILIPADDSNETRALLLLAQEGLITLPADASAAVGVTTLDIVDNGGYDIQAVQADMVPAQLANSDEGTVAVINGNYALQAGLKVADALAIEDASGDAAQTYANIIACRTGEENSEKVTALVNALKTDAVKAYIESSYNGAVVAIF
ncbi:MAG: metal ABC transporter substrate-binding protein [Oscillospiraceae bacterium]|nr:metal ABC transporter substrate-binding protein [Oscillospiraceae bacterium]MBR2928725.1 metal ABC transporter substrate-binding protein [Oscillospiraceae bacterium]